MVVIEADIEFSALDGYFIYVRENNGATLSFLSMRFESDGRIVLENPGTAVLGGYYSANQRYRVRLIFDMDKGTYDAFLDDEVLVEDQAHGVTNGRGIGSVITGFGWLAAKESAFIIDDLQVGSGSFDLIFKGDFESF